MSLFSSGKCVDVTGISRAAGTVMQLWTCSGGVNQQLTWQSDGTIRVYGGTMCLDAYTAQGNNGNPIVIWSCTGGANQQWTATAAGEIRGINGKCIDVKDINPNNGATLQLWTCSGGSNQKWDNGGSTTGSAATIPSLFSPGKCMDVSAGSQTNGTTLQIWTCSGGVNQQFTWTADGTLRAYGGTMCLDAYTAQGNNGNPIVIWSCTGGANQQWTATAAGEIQGINGKCIDVKDINPNNGATLQLWTCSGGPNQRWDAKGGATATPPPPSATAVASVSVSPASASLTAGQTTQLTATPKDASGNALTGRVITWASSNTAIATANGSGLVTGIASGTATVVATSEGHSASATVTVSAAFGGVAVYPGQSIQAAVNGNPAGTAFLLKTGTHRQQSVVPKAGDVFQGEPGTVLDGENATTYAFRGWNGSWVNNVTIRGLKITRYAPPNQEGAVSAGNLPGDATSGWVVANNEISYNLHYGIRIGDGMQVLNNNIHHNTWLNIGGGGNNVLIEGNEIAYGYYTNEFGSGNRWEMGGTKFVNTDGLTLRNNYVHDNLGVGLWTDTDNINTLIEGNRIADNKGEGIVVEIGYRTVIRNNTITSNGWDNPSRNWLWGAGIGIHASADVEVYGNTISGNYNGITGIQQNRGSGRYGTYLLVNLYVHDNIITQTTPGYSGYASAAAGMAQDVGDNAVFTSRNNRFANNTYYLGANANPFEWMGGWRTEQAWRTYGNDTGGSFNR